MQPEQVDFQLEGYEMYWHSAKKKGYSGTAVFTRITPKSITLDLEQPEHGGEGRVMTLEYDDFFLVNVYSLIPNEVWSAWSIACNGRTISGTTL